MQQQQQSKPLARHRISHIMRVIFFTVTLLAVLVTGILAIMTGATSPSTVFSGALTVIVAIPAVIQIYPILFPPTTSTVNPPLSSPQNVQQVQTATKAASPIFFFNLPLRAASEFYGRKAARTTLLTRTSNGGSSSIVGERRAGKTWLLEYLQLVAPTYSTLGPTYRIGCVSATHPQSKTLANFVRRTLEALKVPEHTIDTSQPPLNQLSRGVRNLRDLGMLPVLCIDEFDGFNNLQEYNNDFFDGLRALTQDDGLILITASKRPLKNLIEDLTGQTSPLFNIVQQISLHPFTESEAHDFVRNKGDAASFDDKERAFFLRRSTLYNTNGEPYWPPLRLQLVGQMLLDDKLAAQGNATTYKLDDINYQHDFERRLNETYHAVVRHTQ